MTKERSSLLDLVGELIGIMKGLTVSEDEINQPRSKSQVLVAVWGLAFFTSSGNFMTNWMR